MKRKTIRNTNDIVASIKYIAREVPGLREHEIVGYAFEVMAKDLKDEVIDSRIWNKLTKIDFEDARFEYSDTRGVSIEDDVLQFVIDSYMERDEVKRAPLAYVTKLVLVYVRQKLQLEKVIQENEQFAESKGIVDEAQQGKITLEDKDIERLGDLKVEEAGRLVRLNRYLNLLIHTDSVSIEKIKRIDEIMEEK